MVKNYIPDKNHHLAIAIKKTFEAGMKPIDIANLFGISRQRFNYWLHTPLKKEQEEQSSPGRKLILLLNGQETNRLWNVEFQQKIYKQNLINYLRK